MQWRSHRTRMKRVIWDVWSARGDPKSLREPLPISFFVFRRFIFLVFRVPSRFLFFYWRYIRITAPVANDLLSGSQLSAAHWVLRFFYILGHCLVWARFCLRLPENLPSRVRRSDRFFELWFKELDPMKTFISYELSEQNTAEHTFKRYACRTWRFSVKVETLWTGSFNTVFFENQFPLIPQELWVFVQTGNCGWSQMLQDGALSKFETNLGENSETCEVWAVNKKVASSKENGSAVT